MCRYADFRCADKNKLISTCYPELSNPGALKGEMTLLKGRSMLSLSKHSGQRLIHAPSGHRVNSNIEININSIGASFNVIDT
jgi:hypothetical protein